MLSQLSGNLERLFWYWIDGLSYLVPDNLRKFKNKPANSLLIYPEQQAFRLEVIESSSLENLGSYRINRTEEHSPEALNIWLHEFFKQRISVALLVPEKLILRKQLTLPNNAQEHFKEILSFEMDRLTPFSPEEIYFDYIDKESQSAKENVQLDLYIIKKEEIDCILEELKSYDLFPDQVTLEEGSYLHKQINFLNGTDKKKIRENISAGLKLLALCSVLITFVTCLVPLSFYDHKLAELQTIIAKERARITGAGNQQQNSDFTRKKLGYLPPILILSELTSLIKDDTWVNRVSINGKELLIQGESESAASLIALIEDSKYFEATAFSSPVTRNSVSGRDRFTLSTNIK